MADEVEKRARVMLIGYAGGGVRNIFANKPLADPGRAASGLKVRVQGAPIWSRTFQAAGMAPTVIAYNEIYNAIQNGVIDAGENEAAGVEQMRFFEVAPQLAMTQHAITIRPLCFSSADLRQAARTTFRRRSAAPGARPAIFGRQIESEEDETKLEALEKAGRLKRVEFTERAQMKRLVDPVIADYAKEIDAEPILRRINATAA